MSAYIVDYNHIAYLVAAGQRLPHLSSTPGCWLSWYVGEEERHELRPGGYDEARRIGQILWDENTRSVNYRYRNHEPEPNATFVLRSISGDIDPVQVLAAVRCYRYQACETPDYYGSEAELYLRALENLAIDVLIDQAPLATRWGAPEIRNHGSGPYWQPANPLQPSPA